ncbi:MAG: CHAT domain-containing protein [Pseudonocardiaceae bacterium]
MGAPGEEFWVDQGSPLAVAIAAAREACERGDIAGADAQYRRAVRLAGRECAALAAEHVSRLRSLDSTRALACCEEYIASDGTDIRLLLLRAETDVNRGDYSRIDAELAAIHRITGGRPARHADNALLSRLDGLAAKHHGRFSPAKQHLRRARDRYAALGDTVAVAVVDDDLRLTRSEQLRVIGRYEEALHELAPALQGPLDAAVRFDFLEAQVRLLRLLRADGEADDLMPALYQAARESARPEENLLAAQRLDPASPGLGAPVTPDRALQQVRRLVRAGRLAEAHQLLLAESAPTEHDNRHAAEWQLAAGELTLIMAMAADRDRKSALVGHAISHFQESARHAASESLIAIRTTALWLRGQAHAVLDDMNGAVEAWSAAHRLEEEVAARQPSHAFRLRMLRGAPTEFDERIRVTEARAVEADDPLAGAAVVVAMEAARGTAILPQILPGHEPLVRKLPAPSDIAGAHRWIRRAVRGLPRSQIIWMLHATPNRVHHAFIRRTPHRVLVHHMSAPCERNELIKSILALTHFWTKGSTTLEAALRGRDFDRQVLDIARLLGFEHLRELPEDVERIAVVAGGELSEIPFALLPCPGEQASELLSTLQPCLADGALIGRRYALSDLPCLSVLGPLRRRSHGQRGTRGKQMLLLQPNAAQSTASGGDRLVAAEQIPGRTVLHQGQATPAALREALADGRYRQVRIDSHGEFERAPSQEPVIRLAPAGAEGEMDPAGLESMSLGATGTLVLGACETGMAKRIGRDERTGFVRAGLLSGASAVVAARWKALDPVAARVLDRFEKNLRHHPRDVALFLAQREEEARDRSADPPSRSLAIEAHPARWAPWTLYGDAGQQTRRGPLRRWLFRPRHRAMPTLWEQR